MIGEQHDWHDEFGNLKIYAWMEQIVNAGGVDVIDGYPTIYIY